MKQMEFLILKGELRNWNWSVNFFLSHLQIKIYRLPYELSFVNSIESNSLIAKYSGMEMMEWSKHKPI